MAQPDKANLWSLAELCTPWCVHVAATLRVAEHLNAGISDLDQLGAACGADAESLGRVLRHLVGVGVFEEPEPGRFTLNDAARGFLEPGMQLVLDLDSFGGRMAYAWGTLLQAVRTGKSAYHTVFGRPYWDDLEANPEIAAKFDALMGPAGHGAPDADIPIAGGWEKVRTVVDVGGGTGSLLAAVLQAHPHVRGVLVDLPRTAERAQETFQRAGLADRVTIVGQSFFDPLPPGADVYMMKNVLADWPDAEAARLLRRCAEAALPNGRVLLLGGVSPDENGPPSPELLMLVLVGGKQRTLAQFRKLARDADLDVTASGKTGAGRFFVECKASE